MGSRTDRLEICVQAAGDDGRDQVADPMPEALGEVAGATGLLSQADGSFLTGWYRNKP
jgi:hypothetical protein